MNRNALVRAVAKRTDTTLREAAAMVDATLAVVIEALARGESVRLPRFGEFAVRERAARVGRNVRTGETVSIPARLVPVFRPGKALREAVAGK